MTKRLIPSLALGAALVLSACNGTSDQTAGQSPATASQPQPPTQAQSQAPAIVQPGAPGQASTTVSSVPAFQDSTFTDADVKFMQGMIHHHNQALQMAAMIPTHTKTLQLQAMGQRITISQSGEIKWMSDWLTTRKQEVPMIHADGSAMMSHGDMAPMPGMLTAEQMKALDAAREGKFDELFLTGMIQHHKGALTMVTDVRAAGGGKETNIGDFLSQVDNDQRAEIVRMYGLLGRPVEWK